MAIYEYRCLDCGARLEVMQKMGSKGLSICGDECAVGAGARPKLRGKGRIERLFSAVNVGGRAASGGSPRADDPSCGRCGRVGPDVCSG